MEPLHQMQFSVMPRVPFLEGSYPFAEYAIRLFSALPAEDVGYLSLVRGMSALVRLVDVKVTASIKIDLLSHPSRGGRGWVNTNMHTK